MVNLPRRAETVDVEIPETDAVLHLRPLDERQQVEVFRTLAENADSFSENGQSQIRNLNGGWYEVIVDGETVDKVQGRSEAEARLLEEMETAEFTISTQVVQQLEAVAPFFDIVDANLIGAENVEIDGEPFDADRSDHRASIPMAWKGRAVNALVGEAFMSDEVGKGSGGPVAPSTGVTTPPGR